MKFKYIGDEYTEWFGFKWMQGTEHDVTDEHAIKKLSGSALFEALQTPIAAPVAPKRQPKIAKDVADGDALPE